MRAEIIAIGDELTTGQRLDTNSQWLSQRLTELGIEVAFHTTVGDELADNAAVFRLAFGRADIVISTGGLGPTADELTRYALADATGTQLWRDAQSLAHIEQMWTSRGRQMPERNQIQADFPGGATPIPNRHGTAPGIEMIIAREGRSPCAVFALPGVPVEMHEIWQASVAPRIVELRPERAVIRHRRIKCFGVGESQLEAMLPDLIRRGREPKVGITVSDATITLRITACGCDDEECAACMEPTVAIIRESLREIVFGEEDDELEHVVMRGLAARNETLAVAEWATGGQIASWLSAVDPRSRYFLRGVVVDNRPQFAPLSNIVKIATPDDAKVAICMAEAVRSDSGADWGLAVAAFPPDPFAPNARVCIAIASAGTTRKLRFSCASHPAILRSRTAKQALNALRLELAK